MNFANEYDIGYQPTKRIIAEIALSEREGITYLFFLRDFHGAAEIRNCGQPRRVRLLRTGQELAAEFADGTLSVSVPESARTGLPDVVEVAW